MTQHKKMPGKELTTARREASRNLSQLRSLIERIFERMKRYKILRAPFKGTSKQFHRVFNTVGGLQRGDPTLMHSAEMLDLMVNDPAHSKCWIGLAPEEIKFVLVNYVEAIERAGTTPPFRNCASTASARGNGRKLEYEHAMYLSLMRIKAGLTQEKLACLFGVDQSAVCRYLKLNERVMAEMPPTPKNISKQTAGCKTDGERKKFMPGKKGGDLVNGGTRVPRARPSDEAEQRDHYTHKNKTRCTNTLTVTNRRTATVHVSETLPGNRNYTVMPGRLAEAFPSMADPDTPDEERIRLIGDSGFQESEKRLPGTVPVNPAKRTGKELTASQKEWNMKISKTRYKIESTYADMKWNQILRRPFRGTAEHFNRVFSSGGPAQLRPAVKGDSRRHQPVWIHDGQVAQGAAEAAPCR